MDSILLTMKYAKAECIFSFSTRLSSEASSQSLRHYGCYIFDPKHTIFLSCSFVPFDYSLETS